jgi:uncharacterized protein DUF6166
MKVYQGTRTEHGAAIVVDDNGECRSLDPRHDLAKLSRDGFDWGTFTGGGPVQLALALAADVLGDDKKAQEVYRQLLFRLVGGLPDEGWVLTEEKIWAAIRAIEQRQTRQLT